MKKILAIAIVVGAAFWVLPTDAEAGELKEYFPRYGNWCGWGHGGGDTVDALDEACKRHDECYKAEGDFNCGCDEVLIDEISGLKIPRDGKGAVALAGIRLWFKNEHRVCTRAGIPTPPSLDPLRPFRDPGGWGKRLLCGIWC